MQSPTAGTVGNCLDSTWRNFLFFRLVAGAGGVALPLVDGVCCVYLICSRQIYPTRTFEPTSFFIVYRLDFFGKIFPVDELAPSSFPSQPGARDIQHSGTHPPPTQSRSSTVYNTQTLRRKQTLKGFSRCLLLFSVFLFVFLFSSSFSMCDRSGQ